MTDFRSGRLIKLQNLNEIASYIIAPALGIPSNESEGPKRSYSEGSSKEPSTEPSKEHSRGSSSSRERSSSQAPSSKEGIREPSKEHSKEQEDHFKGPLVHFVDKEHSMESTFSKELSVITAASDVLCQLINSDDDDDDDKDDDDDSDSDIDDGYEHIEGKRYWI